MSNSSPSADPKEFEVRRIFLAEDAERIRRMQSDARVFVEHYPEHNRWLDMALSEVIRGKRIAFGVYRTLIDGDHRLALHLIGSIILKGNRFTGVVELKNLFIQESQRKKGFGRALYDKVEDYCTKTGFLRVETEVPVSELGTVSFLHSVGFEVVDCYSSPYRVGDRVYRMWRALSPRYIGDPFDLPELSRWLLTNAFGFKEVRSDKEPQCLRFDVAAEALAINETQQSLLQGLALIKDDVVNANDISVAFAKRAFDLGILFCQELEASARDLATQMRIRTYDVVSIKQRFLPLLAHHVPNFPTKEVGGFVLNINAELFSRIADRKLKESALFKNGSVGKYLKRGNKVLLISEPSTQHPLGGVQSVGVIDDAYADKPDTIWERYCRSKPLFSKEEYTNYTREKELVLGLRVIDLEPVPTVDYHVLLKEIIKDKVEIAELGCCYLSEDMIDGLKGLRRLQTSLPTLDTTSFCRLLVKTGNTPRR
jgi:GNAT superfamily N-acetyltransferase